jgi:hypothetical protein
MSCGPNLLSKKLHYSVTKKQNKNKTKTTHHEKPQICTPIRQFSKLLEQLSCQSQNLTSHLHSQQTTCKAAGTTSLPKTQFDISSALPTDNLQSWWNNFPAKRQNSPSQLHSQQVTRQLAKLLEQLPCQKTKFAISTALPTGDKTTCKAAGTTSLPKDKIRHLNCTPNR